MLVTNYNKNRIFRNHFTQNLQQSSSLSIASGYFGKSEVDRHYKSLIDLAKQGGEVKLIHGMAGSEGLAPKLQNTLEALHRDLQQVSNSSAIYISKQRYHGKLYIFDKGNVKNISIGSSNFSLSGFETNIELNVNSSENDLQIEAQQFFNQLLTDSIVIDKFKLPQRGTQTIVQRAKAVPSSKINALPVSYTLPLRVKPKSSLNLFLSSGRLNSNTGIYTPRPFYEVELTIPKSYWVAPLTNFVANQNDKQVFDAITDTGMSFEVNFKRKTTGKGDKRGIHQTGGDFMSSPREDLGLYIKGKLMQAGLLRFGEPITEDILESYGNDKLEIIDLGNKELYIKF